MNKGKPRAQGSQTAQQMAFSWLLYFSWHLSKSFSVSPCQGCYGGRDWGWRLPIWICWVMSNAGAMPSPSLLPWTSFFQKEKQGWKFLPLAQGLTTSSVQLTSFLSLTKHGGQRELKNFCPVFFFFYMLVRMCMCMCACVCVCWKLQKKL